MSVKDPRIGTRIADKYLIERRIARGGMGSVYLARHEYMNRQVALKLLHENQGSEEQKEIFFKRFQREARAASQLEHPNAVTIYDFGLYDGLPYLAMEYIAGRNLSSVISTEGALEPERAYHLFSQVCSAIQAAHELTIAHRDIKPDNILIRSDEEGQDSAHVLDFGIAKAMRGSNTMVGAMTAAGKTVGTPRYMSPEQALGKEVTLETDVYSLGVVLYEMLVGEIPFSADTPVELMYEHLNAKPKAIPKQLNIPASVEAVIQKALEKEPADRFRSPAEFAQALTEALERETPKRGETGLPPKLLPAAAALAVFAALVFFLYTVFGQSPGSSDPVKRKQAQSDSAAHTVENTAENTAVSTARKSVEDSAENTEPEAEQTQAEASAEALAVETSTPVLEDSTIVDDSPVLDYSPAAVEDTLIEDTESEADLEASVTETADEQTPEVLSQESASGSAAPVTPVNGPVASSGAASESRPQQGIAEPEPVVQENPKQESKRKAKISELVSLLDSENRTLRLDAAVELQKRGTAAVPALVNALGAHPSPRVRYLSAFILGKLKAREAIPALSRAQEDPSAMVARTARRAIISIKRD